MKGEQVTWSYKDMMCVRMQNIQPYIQEGWQVIYIFQEIAPAVSAQSIPCPGGSSDRCCNHGHYGTCYSMIDVGAGSAVTSTYAVLARGESPENVHLLNLLEEKSEQIVRLEGELHNTGEESRKFANDYLNACREMERMADTMESLGEKVATANDMLAEATLHAQRMESDLAKVREHVGKKAFEEALTAETKKEN